MAERSQAGHAMLLRPQFFRSFGVPRRAKRIFTEFWDPPMMGIFGINRVLDPPKVTPITRSGREPKF